MKRYSLFLIILISLLFIPHPALATNSVVGTGTPASCTEATFNAALATVQSSGNGIVSFNCGGPATIVFTSGKVISNATVTIDGGNNITLSGGNSVRHFYIEANAFLTVKNIILKSGYDNTFGGGSILSLGGVSLDNATIRDSNVDSGHSGGAIMSYTLVLLTNSLIENNTGGSAGGLFLFGEAADATITGSTLRNNRTTNVTYGLGGAITAWDGADVTLQNTTLTQNQAQFGGGIYSKHADTSILIEQNSVLSENIVLSTDGGGGGGIYNDNGSVVMTGGTITGNSSGFLGGGMMNYSGIVTLTNVTISNNSTNLSNGGGIVNYGQLTITGGALTGNSSGFHGGGLYNVSSEPVALTNVTISNNTAEDDGGGIYNNRLSAINNQVWANLTIQNNTSGRNGGGIYAKEGSLVINTATISDNTSSAGAGIYFWNGNLTLTDLKIQDNVAAGYFNIEDGGGGIYINGTANIFDSTISGNSTGRSGGGIFLLGGALNIYRTTLSGNTATTYGGGAIDAGHLITTGSIRSWVINLTNVTVSQNRAFWGGGLSLSGGQDMQSNLNYVTFYGNSADYGDSLHLYTGTTTFKNVILQSDSGSNCHFFNGATITSAGFNLASDSSCNLNGTADLQNTNAQLGPLNDNGGPTLTHLPRPGSPALNSGQCIGGISNDQRGTARPQNGVCDRGSVERKADDIDYRVYLPLIIR